ncbi:MAG: LysR substrate-binding domain-containing protein [Rhodobacter sp.]|nr:LysR substrate-binding domain-containing protein [Rhodobacter sp.]
MDDSTRRLPTLSRLKPFEAAARHESFTLAAAELGLTQTAVSKQVAQLEHELGTLLFERKNRAVFLTDAGRRFGRVVGTALSDIAAEAAYLQGKRTGNELILLCQLCEAFYWIMPRLSRFHERHPGTELQVVSTLKPLTEASEHFDVAIQTTGRLSGTARLAFTVSDEIFPVCSSGFLPSESLPIEPRYLIAHPLLSHRVTPQDWTDWPDWFEAVGQPVPHQARFIYFNSFPLVLQAAVAGQGIALGWRRTVEGMIDEGKLVRPCADTMPRPTELSIYAGAGRQLHPETDKLLGWLSDEFAD